MIFFNLLVASVFLAIPASREQGFSINKIDTNTAPVEQVIPKEPAPRPMHERLAPLQDLLARGEGNYNSVNRGYAGDTPGGIVRLTGKSFSRFTVAQVIEMQRWTVYAVGRYQFVPRTLMFALRHSDVTRNEYFTPEVQDRLMVALIMHKRPAIGAYLRGEHDNLHWALIELSREWASVEYMGGRGYYDHIGGNRASISRQEAGEVLRFIKDNWHLP